MEESIKKLNEENGKRAQKITTLAKHNNLIETDNESPNAQRSNSSFRSPRDGETSAHQRTNVSRDSFPSHTGKREPMTSEIETDF